MKKALTNCRWNWDLGTISPTFYEKLLRAKIPKAQKIQSSCHFFAILESACIKCDCKMLQTVIKEKLCKALLYEKVNCWWNWDLGLISPTFYAKLLREKIPKHKKIVKLSLFFSILGSVGVQCDHKMLVKLRPVVNFINICMYNIFARSSQKRNNSVKLSVSFYAFGIYWRKSCL